MRLATILGILLSTTPWCSSARPIHTKTIEVNSGNQHYRVEDYSTFYFDESSKLKPEQALYQYQMNRFKPLTRVNTNFTHSIGMVWLAFEIENMSDKALYLNFRSVYLEQITIYSSLNEYLIEGATIGSSLPFEKKAFKSGGYIVEIPKSVTRNKHLVLCAIKIDDKAPMIIRGEIGTLSTILNNNRIHESITMAIIGILMIMLFYNASLFIVTRDVLYFYYCFHLVSSVIVVGWFNGLLFEWIWPKNPEYNKFTWPIAIYFVTQLIFINRMLQVNHFLPIIYKVSFLFMGLLIFTVFTSFTHIAISSALIFGSGIVLPLYYVFLIFSLIKRRERIIYIFILGWTPMLIVTLFNSLMTIGLFNYTEVFGLHGVEICLAWEVAIFSLALGYRYNLIKQQIISVQEENLSIIENQKSLLEKMVSERTEEILAQNEVLIRNQDQIQMQNEKLESQNRAYEKLRELVLKQNQNLESAVNKRTIELADANHELKNNLRKIERFNFIAAHNLRGPVARILGLCMLIEKEEPEKDSINYQIIEKLKYSTKELDVIIHDLILILDIQSQNDKNYKKINPVEAIQKVLQQFSNELKKDNFKIDFNSSVDVITVIPEYFDNIFINLISNSIKYKNLNHEKKITIGIEMIDRNIIIDFHDNGIGFESAHFEQKLFEPFQKFHANSDGKGLGLFLIKSQISAMGGKIKLWSKPDMGINITIHLPDHVWKKTTLSDSNEDKEKVPKNNH